MMTRFFPFCAASVGTPITVNLRNDYLDHSAAVSDTHIVFIAAIAEAVGISAVRSVSISSRITLRGANECISGFRAATSAIYRMCGNQSISSSSLPLGAISRRLVPSSTGDGS